MEGYTNLSLIKEEDFTKHGVGHLHAKNASKRVYQNRRGGNSHVNPQAFGKGRKASEATTVGGTAKKQYNSVDNRFETPLKLPNLANPASKRSSNAQSGGGKQGHLSTVVESAHSRANKIAASSNGKVCQICAKIHRVGHPHNSISGPSHKTDSGVKGAPYYQPMSLQKPTGLN